MGTYVVMTTLTAEGRKRLEKDPDRLAAVSRDVEKMGAKISRQYATLGEYDFVTFVEAPDNAAIAQIGAELAGLGTMKHKTLPAIGMERFTKLLKIAPYRTEPHRWQTSWWASLVRRVGRRWVTYRHVKAYCRPFTVEGRENIARFKGGAIVIANHSSHFDTPVVIASLPPQIRNKILAAAAADKFYGSRRKRTWWYSLFHGTFPVHRGRHEAVGVPVIAAAAGVVDPDLSGGRAVEGGDPEVQARAGDHGDAGGRAGDPDLHRGVAQRDAEGAADAAAGGGTGAHRQAGVAAGYRFGAGGDDGAGERDARAGGHAAAPGAGDGCRAGSGCGDGYGGGT